MRHLVIATLLVGLAALGQAQPETCSLNGTLSVSGAGTVQVQPDVAKVNLNVESTRKTARNARDEAAKVATAVIDAVGAVDGISPYDITTVDISITPQYFYDDNGRTQNLTGYTFSQRMVVKVNNLTNDMLSAVVDAAVEAGGNALRIESIQAELSEPVKQVALNEARGLAVQDANNTATVLAEASGVGLGPIKSLSDNTSPPNPYPVATKDVLAVAGEALSTPVNIGTTDVTASVSAEYVICN